MSKSTSLHVLVSRRGLVRVALAVVALFLLALIPGAVGKTFWVAFALGFLVLIVLGVLALVQSRRARAR